jgi:membrane-bound lytic murein transglycosylase D
MRSRARSFTPVACLLAASLAAGACGSNPKPQTTPLPQAASPELPPAESDPVSVLIARSNGHFEQGQRELQLGHLDRARLEFDRAVDVLLQAPYGARTNDRLREHFDRLIDRINAHELTALAQGDGFSEAGTEPASLDEILAIATFPDADDETAEAVKADLAATTYDVPIPQNTRVLAAVELLSGRLRDYVQASLGRGAKYLPMIQNVFRAEGLPLDLAYIPIIESGFKMNALSKARALGPWQFMRATANDHGLKMDWYIDERSDPEKSTLAAATYLKTLYRMFDGDWHLVLAAYNGGLGRLQRAMTRAGTSDFWSLASSSEYLPRETREYVPLILAAIIVSKNPTQYGLEPVEAEPIAYDKVALPRAVDLRRVAEWTGTSIDAIRDLNPELRRWTTPVRYPQYEVKVPAGTAEQLAGRLSGASPSEFGALNWYTVRAGETLTTVARKLKVNRVDLAQANHMTINTRLRAGQDLIIPRPPATLVATRTDRPEPATVASRAIAGSAAVAAGGRTQAASGPVIYQVKRGDTLSSIARTFNTTVERIRDLNQLSSTRILVGERLTVRH